MVLVLGAHEDPLDPQNHAAHVRECLSRLGVEHELLDTRWFPAQARLWCDPAECRWRLRLPNGRELADAQIHSVYWRQNYGPRTHDRYVSQNDARGLLESFLATSTAR